MNRRSALRGLAGSGLLALGGCVSAPGTSPRSSESPSGRVQRRLSLSGQDTVREGAELRIEASVLDPTVTDSQTARIRVTITNDGPSREISVSTGRCALFNRYSQASTPRGLWLGLADEAIYVTQTGPRWIAEPPDNGAFPDYGCAGRTYEPGESVSVEYAIYDDDRAGGYLESGTYRFEEDVLITPGPSAKRDADASLTINWGFSLDIENPNCTLCL